MVGLGVGRNFVWCFPIVVIQTGLGEQKDDKRELLKSSYEDGRHK